MSEPSNPTIEFSKVSFRLAKDRALLSDVNLSVRSGETLMLLGRSGSGKTTCLKMINRLYSPTTGEVRVDGIPVTQWDIIKLRRRIGYAIQDVGLFPHYTVHDNVALVPKLEQWEQARIDARVEEVLALVGLPAEEFARRYPHQLSGGQRQRVGLARALAADPPILLMDEPFGALDPITRSEIQMEFKKLQQKLAKTILLVTHDLDEALYLADRIVLVEEGRIAADLPPEGVLRSDQPEVAAYVRAFHRGT